MNNEQFELLDKKTEEVLKNLLSKDNVADTDYKGTEIDHLVKHGYIVAVDIRSVIDKEPVYRIEYITQKGKAYFEFKQRLEDESRKLTRREWRIAIVSVIIGAMIGLIPTVIQWFG